jgi:hypothetical protein
VGVQRTFELPAVAVLLAPSCGLPARAASRPFAAPVEDQGSILAVRLNAWLEGLGETPHAEPPRDLAPWLAPVAHAIVPLATPGWCAGQLLVPMRTLTRASLYELRDRAFDLALSIEEADRAWTIAHLAPPC